MSAPWSHADPSAPPVYIHPEFAAAVDQLAAAYAGTFSRETVANVVVDSYTSLAR